MTLVSPPLGTPASKEGVLVWAVYVGMVWSDQQRIAAIKANGTENWCLEQRFQDFLTLLTPDHGKE